MEKLSLVSVIIPTYNAQNYIAETVKSVLQQSVEDIEIIIINDGSTDESRTVLEELKNTDQRISLIDKPNSGVCDTRNLGIKKATGKYITFLDADDLWEKTFLEECLKVFEVDQNIKAVYSKVQLINEKSDKLDKYLEANTIQSVKDVLEWKRGYVASMGCTIYDIEIVKQVGEFDTNLSTAADQDFHLRVAAITPIVGLNKTLFYYRIHSNNMHANIEVMEKDHIYVFEKAKKLNFYHSFWFQQKCFARLYLTIAGSWWKDGKNKLRGVYFVLKSMMSYPLIVFKIFQN